MMFLLHGKSVVYVIQTATCLTRKNAVIIKEIEFISSGIPAPVADPGIATVVISNGIPDSVADPGFAAVVIGNGIPDSVVDPAIASVASHKYMKKSYYSKYIHIECYNL